MTTKKQMIDLLKIEFPTLQVGDEDNGYTELSVEDYEATIAEWAEVRLTIEAKTLEAEAKKATQRQALLARLGITEEEARILLGGN